MSNRVYQVVCDVDGSTPRFHTKDGWTMFVMDVSYFFENLSRQESYRFPCACTIVRTFADESEDCSDETE
jgi:hypothetical protein